MTKMPLKENIKRYRLAAHMTLENVANAIGVSKQTVQKYEHGVISNIPSDKIEGMAKLFGCSPADLMGWNIERLPANAIPIPAYHMKPVIGEIACGTPILAEQNIEGYEPCPDFALLPSLIYRFRTV
jgi:repressor LexA